MPRTITMPWRIGFRAFFPGFLLMPGLLFQVFRFLGVRRRVAWSWMWIVPAGSVFVLQAGSVANDAVAAVFFLASIAYAFRARKTGKFSDAALSLFSIALVSSAKTLNQPLVLPWLIAIWPVLGLVWKNWARALACAAIALVISIAPSAALNQYHCGDWTGLSAGDNISVAPKAGVAVIGNMIQLAAQNFAPPVFPGASAVETKIRAAIPRGLREKLVTSFEAGFAIGLGELQMEETAGLGFSVSILAAIALGYSVWRRFAGKRKTATGTTPISLESKLILGAVWIGFMVLLSKSSISVIGRVSATFYPLLVATVLVLSSNDRLTRIRLWRQGATFAAALSMLIVILTPARPLWPAQTVFNWLSAKTTNQAVQRAAKVYRFYGQRADCLAPIKALIPPGTRTVGFVSRGDDPETSLWLPFGSRAIRGVTPRTDLTRRDYDYVVVNPEDFPHFWKTSFEKWLERTNASIVNSAKLNIKVSVGSVTWHLVKLPARNGALPVNATAPPTP